MASGSPTTDPLADQLVEVADHLAVRGEVLRAHRSDGLGHARHELVEHLALELLHELVEPLPRRRLQEVVVLQPADPFAEVAGEPVELVEPPGGHVAQHRTERRVGLRRSTPGRAGAPRPALLGDDLLELAPDVAEDVVELVALEHLLALSLESVHQVLEPGHVAAGGIAGAPAALHQPSERLGDVALGHHVVGEGVEDLVGIEVGDELAAVPARIPGRAGQRVGAPSAAGPTPLRRAAARCPPRSASGPGHADQVSTRSPVVDRPARDPVLVEAAGEVESLEQEFDGGGDDGGLLGSVGQVVGAKPVEGEAHARDLADEGDVRSRRRSIACLDREAVLERLDDALEVVE